MASSMAHCMRARSTAWRQPCHTCVYWGRFIVRTDDVKVAVVEHLVEHELDSLLSGPRAEWLNLDRPVTGQACEDPARYKEVRGADALRQVVQLVRDCVSGVLEGTHVAP